MPLEESVMSPRKKDAWTDAVWISMISYPFIEIWGKCEMVSLYGRTYVRFFRKIWYIFIVKESCHLESKMPKHMPFEILRYIIQFSRYKGKSEMISLYGGHFGFSRQIGNWFKNQRNVSPITKETLKMPFKFLIYLI